MEYVTGRGEPDYPGSPIFLNFSYEEQWTMTLDTVYNFVVWLALE